MDSSNEMMLSVALNVMGRLEHADYGFKSWMLQDYDKPYEVILNLFNDARPRYEKLAEGRNPNCRLVINTYDRPAFFNISAANNLALHAATGKYILLVNSDVVYLGNSVQYLLDTAARHNIYYVVLTRANLKQSHLAQFAPAQDYHKPEDFEFLSKIEDAPHWLCSNGWLARRDALQAIGGFDPRILVCEDVDLTDRLTHYLARNNLQKSILGLVDFCGYHLYHPTSELFDMHSDAQAILRPRRARLHADFASTEDIVPTRLDSLDSLVNDVRNTVKPPPMKRYREDTARKIAGRVKRAFDTLVGRRLENRGWSHAESTLVTFDTRRLAVQGLRIVHYLSDVRLDHGGVTRAVLDWCAALALRGSQVTLVTYDSRDVPKLWMGGAVGLPRIVVLPPPGWMGLRLSSSALRRVEPIIAESDVLHLHAPWLPGNSQLASLARSHQIPYVVSTHGMLDDWCMNQRPFKKRLYLRLVGREILDNAAAVHCTADEELRQARQWFSRAPGMVLPYVFDTSAYASLPGPELSRQKLGLHHFAGHKVLFLSRIDRKKGLDVLISAMSQLMQRAVPTTLVIAGPELDAIYAGQLREQIKQLGLDDRCVFVGAVAGTMKLSLFEACDLLALPTQQENFGLALFESLACRTPIITTRGVDVWRDIESAGGMIVDRNPPAIAHAIDALLDSPDLKERGQRGRDWVMKQLDENTIVAKYEQFYRRISNTALLMKTGI